MSHRFVVASAKGLAFAGLLILLSDHCWLCPPAKCFGDDLDKGRELYMSSCVDCHGENGQGVEGAYENPLLGDDSIGQLSDLISKTMPEGSPEDCTGEDARAVAEFMHRSFYSEAAQIRLRPPRVLFSRLTADQIQQSVSDLYARFSGLPKLQPVETDASGGLKGEYYAGDRWKRSDRKLTRVDSQLSFDWGRQSPVDGLTADQFSIEWSGGLWVKESGNYEIIVHSTCSFVMDFGALDRVLIDNEVQSGGKVEFRETLNLTAGRIYPLQIRFRQRKRKTELPPAELTLSWVPPSGHKHVIPTSNLVPETPPAAFSLQTDLPADDRSYGYERGISVSRDWDDSTTRVALEFAATAHKELWPRYRRRNKDGEPRRQLEQFLNDLVETAFRTTLDTQDRERYITKHLRLEPDDGEAIKRVCLVALKSPRFLYPALAARSSRSQVAANTLALVLFDSLPSDEYSRKVIREGRLDTEDAIRGYARRFVDDIRVRAKTRRMLYAWLNIGQVDEVAKNEEAYPDFDDALASDLKASLDEFLDSVVWSPNASFETLFHAKYAFGSERLGRYYGQEWRPGDPQRSGVTRVDLNDESLGVLTHPYLMSALAYPESTSPIHRGVFLMRYLLGRVIRPPEDAFTPLSPDLHPDLTTRERVNLQTSPDSCQVCHQKINGLGFVLEHYDTDGRFRSKERKKPIDSAGEYVTREGQQVEFDGAEDLASFLATSADSHRAFVARAFQHFVKQPPAAFGTDTLDRLTNVFREKQLNIRELIVEIAVVATMSAVEVVERADTVDKNAAGQERTLLVETAG